MVNGPSLKRLAIARLKTVKLLLQNNEFDVAVYLLGYVVEFALKAIICKKVNLIQYPPDSDELERVFKTHNFDTLLVLSGLSNDINANTRGNLWTNWSELTKWRADMRYEPIGTYTKIDVKEKIKALEDGSDGLLTWIKRNKKW